MPGRRAWAVLAVSTVTAAVVAIPSLTWANATGNEIWGNFQIDGNLTAADYGTSTPPPPGTLDWDSPEVQTDAQGNPAPQAVIHDPIGGLDTTVYATGTKESADPETWANGSAGAPPKGDIGNVYFWSHVGPNGHIYAYVGVERVSTSGTVNYFVELNQKANKTGNDGVTSVPDRTTNDIRLNVGQQGGSALQVTATADTWSCPSPLPAGQTCDSSGSWSTDQSLSSDFYGLVNDGTVSDPAQFGSPIAATQTGTLDAGQFTEFAVDLTAAGFVTNTCGTTVFNNVNVRSVSSLSNSELKDYAAGPIKTPNPCATIQVTKQDMAGKTITNSPATFKFAPDPTLPSTAAGYATSSLTVTDGDSTGVCVPARTPCPGDSDGVVNGVITLEKVQTGATNITVTEETPPAGYFVNSPPSQVIAGPLAASTTYPLTFKDPLGSISWTKLDSATGNPVTVGGAKFTVTATGGAAAAPPWSTPTTPFSETVTDNGTNDANPTAGELELDGLPSGTYTIKEIAPPPGYLLPQPPNDQITGVVVNGTTTVPAGSFTDGYGSLAWQKEDPNGNPLPGASFQVKYPDGTLYNVVDNVAGAPACTPVAATPTTPGTACDADPGGGTFLLQGLPTGTYTITETAPPPGYTLSPNVLTATITDTSFTTVNAGPVFDSQGSISWNKVGPDGVTPLGGATFQLNGPNGFSELVTDNGLNDTDPTVGSIKVVGLAPGAYTIVEVTPPPGYLLPASNNPAASAVIPVNGTATIPAGTITDPLGALAWHKADPNGTPLAGATFQVTYPNGLLYNVVDNVGGAPPCTPVAATPTTPGTACDVDTSGGGFELTGLMAGQYTITEITPPPGYLMPASGNPIVTNIGIGNNTGPVDAGTFTDPLGAISWTKEDVNGTLLAGATFQVTYPNGLVYNVADNVAGTPPCTPVVATPTTPGTACDTDPVGGSFQLTGLMTGKYTVTETAPPPGYLLPTSQGSQSVTIGVNDNTGPDYVGNFEDPLGAITWTKQDSNGAPLAGATFQVTYPNGLVYTVVDNVGGAPACTPVAATPTAPGVACDTDPSGGGFELTGLTTGLYSVQETVPPPGYLLPASGNPSTVTIGVNSTIPVSVGTFTDPLGAITWNKQDTNGAPLAGATFQVTYPDGTVYNVVDNVAGAPPCTPVAATPTTPGTACDTDPSGGGFELTGLKTGTYTIVETAPPPGYLLLTSPANTLTATVTDTSYTPVAAGAIQDPLGAISWHKTDANGAPLAGATFQVTYPNGLVYTVVDNVAGAPPCTPVAATAGAPGTACDTDTSGGGFELTGLMTGTYTITETAPPPGYLLPAAPANTLSVTLNDTDLTVKDAGTIQDPLGAISWHKTDPNGAPLAGATFQVTYPNGLVYNVADNTGSGTCTPVAATASAPGTACDVDTSGGGFELTGLMTGTYTITETAPPPGYLLPAAPANTLSVTLNDTDLTVKNAGTIQDPLGAIGWHKTDLNGAPLAGATFQVKYPNGLVYDVADNSGSGTCTPVAATASAPGTACDADTSGGGFELTGLMTGTYTITETAPPPGYLLPVAPANQLSVTLNDTDLTVKDAGTIKDPLGSIKWTKVSSNGAPLGGATFVVTGPGGFIETVVDNGPNDANKTSGAFEVDGLKTGTYTVRETVPPPGYLLPASGNPKMVTIGVNSNTGAVSVGTFTDPLGSLEWRKLSIATNAPVTVAGAKFSLVATAGPAKTVWKIDETVVDNGSHDADSRAGYIKVIDLPAGTYTITEIAAPAGFAIPATGASIKGVVIGVGSTTTVNAGAITDPFALPIIKPGHPLLPDTGGPSIDWLLLAGGLLMGGSVLIYASRRRNRSVK